MNQHYSKLIPLAALVILCIVPTAAQSDLVYANTSEHIFRANGGAGSFDPDVRRILFDDVPITAAQLIGMGRIRINSITVGIRRGQSSPATDVSIYVSEMASLGTGGIDFDTLVLPVFAGSGSLTPRTDSGFVTELVTVTPSSRLVLEVNQQLLSGFGTIAVGVQFSDTDPIQGWRVNHNISIPDVGAPYSYATGAGAPNLNALWTWDSSLGAEPRMIALLDSGGANNPPNPPSTFYIILDGTAVPEPSVFAAIGLAGLCSAARRRRTESTKNK